VTDEAEEDVATAATLAERGGEFVDFFGERRSGKWIGSTIHLGVQVRAALSPKPPFRTGSMPGRPCVLNRMIEATKFTGVRFAVTILTLVSPAEPCRWSRPLIGDWACLCVPGRVTLDANDGVAALQTK